ncbi:MAG TPA: ATP-dependent zinc metalloprotease FtsH [Candidatus Bathyarchaeia archaeon]|nr:ATP-dependent zinc metalloprotease FtsH [Candidatus Bathyarchaeia archaeon]
MFTKSGLKQVIIVTLIGIGCLLVLHWLTDASRNVHVIPYTTFLNTVEQGLVKEVRVEGQIVYGRYKDGNKFETVIADNPGNWDLLRRHGVECVVGATVSYYNYWIICIFLLGLLVLAFIWYMMRQARNMGGGGNNIFTMGKSRARMFLPSTIKENFDSVAGAAEAKEELKDVIDFLRNPKKYQRLGAKITRGVLLIGEPGNGKTLLARAVAGEANCPFFAVSGSEFIEVFVGVGAGRVRDLFTQARKHAPSIIFIDEIDAVGRHRGSGLGGGNDEREQTLNQLLTEMDGFATAETPVIVLAATNRPDVLDKALLRPGRFDRRVMVPFPDLASREEILRVHIRNVKIDDSVDVKKIARGTPGFSGADLANLINEAAIIASKTNEPAVTIFHIEEARDKILLGKEVKTTVMSAEEKNIVAYHESGHALVRLLLPEHTDPLHKVTIVPRGKALGVTHSMPDREKYLTSKEEMLASVMAALGGRAAEEVVFNKLTTGAYSDFKGATQIARSMICDYGMDADIGLIQYQVDHADIPYSDKTAEKIDDAVKKIVDTCYAKAVALLRDNRDKLDLLAQTLLEKETLYAGDIYTLLGIEPRAEHRFV